MFINKSQNNVKQYEYQFKVDKITSSGKKFDLKIDDRVIERNKWIARTIKYGGPTHCDKGVWFGVALDRPNGKNNETVKKNSIF